MIKIDRLYKINILAVLLVVVITTAVYGQPAEVKPVADEMISSSGIYWTPKVNYSQLTLTISRPDGTVYRKTFNSGGTPYVDLSSIYGDNYMDGSYIYELRVTPQVSRRVRSGDNDELSSREPVNDPSLLGPELIQTGAFLVQGGAIVSDNMKEPRVNAGISTGQEGLSGTADQVFADDLIVQGSACIGIDCVNGETFSFDTIRLKENNLRIKFDDTSSTAGFPNVDWQLTANDSASGGANKFSIDDITNSRTPFTVISGAPTNSLFVSSGGRVGFGTSTPVLDLHKVSGNTPGIRLEQNNSSGFSPQTWDIAGNEANFFIRDVTGGSRLPFRIRPGAPTSSIDISASGHVGFGTASPGFPIHLVTDSSTNAAIVAEQTSGATVFMNGTSARGTFGTTSNHPLRFVVNSLFQMDLVGNSDIVMADGGGYNGTWNNASSRALKENIKDLSADDAMKTLEGLTPVTYNYKKDKEEQHVGFIAEDVPELVANKDRKSLSTMDIVSVLTKVVQEQQKTITELKNEISEMKKERTQN